MELTGLIPDFGNFAFTVVAFLVTLTVIVAVHEYGHYIIGRWSGIKADVFSIGMGPVLVSRKDKHGTIWQIAAYPIGGYVKFKGDANAASAGVDGDSMIQMSDAEKRQTMHGAPLWARAATVAAGPIFNFILSIIIFAGLGMMTGVARDPLTVAMPENVPGMENGLRSGDEILSIAGITTPALEQFHTIVAKLPNTASVDYQVLRGGQVIDLQATHPFPPLVGGLSPKSAAIESGLKIGDFIQRIDGQEVATFEALRDIVGNSNGETLHLDVRREGNSFQVDLTPRRQDLPKAEGGFETRWLIGITSGMVFEPATRRVGFFESLYGGVERVIYIISSNLSGLWHMITGAISTCNLSGPIGIAQVSGQVAAQGVSSFIGFIALLSTAIGLINLFPIPVLDGGHLVFFAWEAVTGKAPSEKIMNIMLTVGIAIVLAMMVFGVSNDLFCS